MDNALPLDPTQDLIFPPELLVSKLCVLVVANKNVDISSHSFFFPLYPFFPIGYGTEKSWATLFPGWKGQVDFPSRSERFNQAESWIPQCTSLGWEHNHRLVSRGNSSIHTPIHPTNQPVSVLLQGQRWIWWEPSILWWSMVVGVFQSFGQLNGETMVNHG